MKILSIVNSTGHTKQTIECSPSSFVVCHAWVSHLHPDPENQFDEYFAEYYEEYHKDYDIVERWTIYEETKGNLIRTWLFIKKGKWVRKNTSDHVGFTILQPEEATFKETSIKRIKKNGPKN